MVQRPAWATAWPVVRSGEATAGTWCQSYPEPESSPVTCSLDSQSHIPTRVANPALKPTTISLPA